MRKCGITLIELTLVMVLSSILLLAMTSQFVASVKFQTVVNNEIAVAQESEIAMNHLTQTLGRARPSPAPSNTDPAGQGYTNPITAEIETNTITSGQYLTTVLRVEYGMQGGNLYYVPNTINPAPLIIARNITAFNVTWDGTSRNNNFTISLTASKGNKTVTLNTTIHAIPERAT